MTELVVGLIELEIDAVLLNDHRLLEGVEEDAGGAGLRQCLGPIDGEFHIARCQLVAVGELHLRVQRA